MSTTSIDLSLLSEAQLRATIENLLADEKLRPAVVEMLDLVLSGQATSPQPQAITLPPATSLPPASPQPQTSKSARCVRCGDAFDPEANVEKTCRYHSGETTEYPDAEEQGDGVYDGGLDLGDLGVDGKPTLEYMDRAWMWSCCGHKGGCSGCRLGRHKTDIDSCDTDSEPFPCDDDREGCDDMPDWCAHDAATEDEPLPEVDHVAEEANADIEEGHVDIEDVDVEMSDE